MVRAIDIHIHPPAPGYRPPTADPETRAYFRGGIDHESIEQTAAYYAQLDVFGVIFHSDAETATR